MRQQLLNSCMEPLFRLLTVSGKKPKRVSAVPEIFQNHIIHGATISCYKTGQVSILLQEWKVNGFYFGSHLFIVQQLSQLLFSCEEEKAILAYCLEGDLTISDEQNRPVISLPKNKYNICFNPLKCRSTLSLNKGTHHYLQVGFSAHLLSGIISRVNVADTILTAMISSPSVTCHPYLLPVSKKVRIILNEVITASGRLHPDILHLHTYALRLAEYFVNDVQLKYKQLHWENRKQLKLEELEAYILDHLDTDSKNAVSLKACAKKTGTNTYHFKKLFFSTLSIIVACFYPEETDGKSHGID